jgi:hypothetical protein
MIISDKYKYVFVEYPRTGTTAVSKELCQNYYGRRILRKHSAYQEFLRIASPEEKKYFVFTSVRNPLDDAVSHYFKLRTDHRERYTDREKVLNGKRLAEYFDVFLFRYIQKNDVDFPTYFRKFYVIPYNTWSTISIKRYNYIMRFENLTDDFASVLKRLGIAAIRPLPQRNVTGDRKKEYWTYYTPEIIPRARRIFGPFMKQWGYEFPKEWGEQPVSFWNQAEYEFFTLFRRVYWSVLREHI